MPQRSAVVIEPRIVAEIELRRQQRAYYSNVTDVLSKLRLALLNAPDGDLVVTVEHRAK